MSWKPDVCVYHFPCDDGFASAWVAKKKWPNLILAPSNYGLPFPDRDIHGDRIVYNEAATNLLICDFSYKPDVLADLGERFGSIVVLDHHKTADADLKGVTRIFNETCDTVLFRKGSASPPLWNVVAEFDMEQSGAMLAWRFCFPDADPPALIHHIQDRDLWRMEIEFTRAISLYLRSHPYQLAIWDMIARNLDAPDGSRTRLLNEAVAIERYHDQKLADMLKTVVVKQIGQWDGVPVAHAPYSFASDLAHEMLQAYPDAPFAAVVIDAHGGRAYSLRSEDSRQDVSEVARSFGGGGHRNAAGFRVPV